MTYIAKPPVHHPALQKNAIGLNSDPEAGGPFADLYGYLDHEPLLSHFVRRVSPFASAR